MSLDRMRSIHWVLGGALLIGAACSGAADPPSPQGSLSLASSAFGPDSRIPQQFTCDGANTSPPLKWSGLPAGAKSLALIVDDPDAPAGTWVHWVIFDIPQGTRDLSQDVPKRAELDGGARNGKNDFGKLGYGGPCPPPGPAHRYFFKLYALDARMGLKAGASKADLENAMKGHILAEAQLMGRYGR